MYKITHRKIHTDINDNLAPKVHPLVTKLISSRVSNVEVANAIINPSLRSIQDPNELSDMEIACERLVYAITHNQTIGIVADCDCDGQSGHAILKLGLHNIFKHQSLISYVGKRSKGFGMEQFTQEILRNKPHLIITTDTGSTDEPTIKILKQHGIDTIVTDHHILNGEYPPSACAVINPHIKGDKHLSGCMIAWFLLAGLSKLLPCKKSELLELLDLATIGTIADLVSLSQSINNRTLLPLGLKCLNLKKRPAWQCFSDVINSSFISFTIAPLINAAKRFHDVEVIQDFLLAPCLKSATQAVQSLTGYNEKRKEVASHMLTECRLIVKKEEQDKLPAICMILPEGDASMCGIVASDLKGQYQVTSVVLIQQGEKLSGSGRAIEGMNLMEIFQKIKDLGYISFFGGHKLAAGITLPVSMYDNFRQAFLEISQRHQPSELILEHDGEVPDIDPEILMEIIHALEPYGQGFPYPCFTTQIKIITQKVIKDKHILIVGNIMGRNMTGFHFFTTKLLPKNPFVILEFRDDRKLSFIIKNVL